MKKAIIIGATSGIGRALAKRLAADDYSVGIAGRRLHLLEEVKAELAHHVFIQVLDISQDSARADLQHLIDEMQGVDLIAISAGTGSIDPGLPWDTEKHTIDTNVLGFAAMANVAYHHFLQQGSGHLLGISSIAAIRGGAFPAYHASKAFVSHYLQGLRYLSCKSQHNILLTEVQPGFVATQMAQGDGLFWVTPVEKAAAQIYQAIKKKKQHVYISKRWRLVAWVLKMLPDVIYHKWL